MTPRPWIEAMLLIRLEMTTWLISRRAKRRLTRLRGPFPTLWLLGLQDTLRLLCRSPVIVLCLMALNRSVFRILPPSGESLNIAYTSRSPGGIIGLTLMNNNLKAGSNELFVGRLVKLNRVVSSAVNSNESQEVDTASVFVWGANELKMTVRLLLRFSQTVPRKSLLLIWIPINLWWYLQKNLSLYRGYRSVLPKKTIEKYSSSKLSEKVVKKCNIYKFNSPRQWDIPFF